MISKFSLEIVTDEVLLKEDIKATTENIVKIAQEFYRGKDREIGLVMGVDAENNITLVNVISVGSVTSCSISPRELFKPLILKECAGFINLHNHPSGHIDPSPADKERAAELLECGKIMNVPFLDNYIIGHDSYYCFSEQLGWKKA